MTDIIAKPFDWNDNLSKEAIEDFKGIQKDLPYCTCQNIGMALAKLELMEKLGCRVADPSISREEYKRMSYKENIKAILECHFAGFREEIIDSACNRISELEPKTGHWIYTGDYITERILKCSECGFEHDVSERFSFCPECGAKMIEPQERSSKE